MFCVPILSVSLQTQMNLSWLIVLFLRPWIIQKTEKLEIKIWLCKKGDAEDV